MLLSLSVDAVTVRKQLIGAPVCDRWKASGVSKENVSLFDFPWHHCHSGPTRCGGLLYKVCLTGYLDTVRPQMKKICYPQLTVIKSKLRIEVITLS